MLSKLKWFILALGILIPVSLHASPICAEWPNIRNTSLVVDFDQIRKKSALALDQQSLWIDQLNDFNENYSVAGAKGVAVADFLTVGLSVTASTLSTALNLSGIPTDTTGYINTAEMVTEIATSDSVEEASYRMVIKKSGVLSNTLASYDIIKTLLEAKERFKDHKETIKLLKKTSQKLHSNIKQARQGLEKTKNQLNDINDYKNFMDGICNVVPPSSTPWIFVGFTIADYVGPPKSYNKIPTKYGHLWIKKDNQYKKNKEKHKTELKAKYPKSYRDFTFASPESYNVVALYKINAAVATWDSVNIYVDKYKFYKGKTKEVIVQQVSKDAAKYKYRSTQLIKLINLQESQFTLSEET